MMSFFRRIIRSKYGALVGTLFLVLVASAFALGDITNNSSGVSLFGPAANEVAKVGSVPLGISELKDRVRRVYDNNRRNNPELTIAAFLDEGAVPEVLDQLIGRMAMNRFGEDQGLAISKRLVDAEIARIPAFQSATGRFDQTLYDALLKREGLSDKALREDIRADLLARQAVAPAVAGAVTPEGMVMRYASMLLEQRMGSALPVPAIAFLQPGAADPTRVAAYYKAHGDRFALPERRVVRYAMVDAATLGDRAKPSEADIAAYYNANAARYRASEERTVEQLVIASQSSAKELSASIKSGESLGAIAAKAGLSTSTVGPLTRDALAQATSGQAAQAVFAAPQGGAVGPFKTGLGWALYRVTAIRKLPARGLEDVRAEITEQLGKEKTQAALTALTDSIDKQIGEGATFDELVKANRLTAAATPPLAKSGVPVVKAQAQKPLPEYTPLAAAAFDMEQGDDPQIIPIEAEKRYALVAVGSVVPAGPAPLEDIRPAVEEAWRLAEADAKAKATSEAILARLKAGMPLDKAAAQAGVALPPPQPIAARRGDLGQQGEAVPPQMVALFSMKEGAARIVPVGKDRGYLLVRLDRITTGDARGNRQLLDATRSGLANVLSAEYADQFSHAVQRFVGVSRNDTAIRTADRELRGGGPAQ